MREGWPRVQEQVIASHVRLVRLPPSAYCCCWAPLTVSPAMLCTHKSQRAKLRGRFHFCSPSDLVFKYEFQYQPCNADECVLASGC